MVYGMTDFKRLSLKILLIILLSNLSSVTTMERKAIADAQCHPLIENSRRNVWLITETQKSGLCNQLASIFSFFPVAKLLGADDVLDHMYSRESFEDHWPFHPSKWTPHSFSMFFDLARLQSFWREQKDDDKLQIIDRSENTMCQKDHHLLLSERIVRRDIFYAQNDHQVLTMVRKSGIANVNDLQNTTIKVYTDKGVSFMALYSFWNNPAYLMKVHRSLQPAPTVS